MRIKSLMGVVGAMQNQCLGYEEYLIFQLRRNAKKGNIGPMAPNNRSEDSE
jgi:hypothetical protein